MTQEEKKAKYKEMDKVFMILIAVLIAMGIMYGSAGYFIVKFILWLIGKIFGH